MQCLIKFCKLYVFICANITTCAEKTELFTSLACLNAL